jgi:peptidoglycan/xylan/chitin deacetylase (PgdA/CDA1 family)
VRRVEPRRPLCGLLLVVLALGAATTPARADTAPAFGWPAGARVAVSLSYDDALASQLDHALPALNRRGLKASFYLTLASPTVAQRLPEWRQAAAQGHELGNHTLFHPCSRSAPGRDWVAPHRDLDRTPVAALHDEIVLANTLLKAIDGRDERSFTAPCADRLAGGVPYMPAVRTLFVAAKARAGRGITADATTSDPYDIETAVPVAVDGAALVRLVEDAAAAGTGRALLSITFHGIGAEHLAVSTQAHETLLDHLATHPGRYWVAPLVAIMRHVRATPPGR